MLEPPFGSPPAHAFLVAAHFTRRSVLQGGLSSLVRQVTCNAQSCRTVTGSRRVEKRHTVVTKSYRVAGAPRAGQPRPRCGSASQTLVARLATRRCRPATLAPQRGSTLRPHPTERPPCPTTLRAASSFNSPPHSPPPSRESPASSPPREPRLKSHETLTSPNPRGASKSATFTTLEPCCGAAPIEIAA